MDTTLTTHALLALLLGIFYSLSPGNLSAGQDLLVKGIAMKHFPHLSHVPLSRFIFLIAIATVLLLSAGCGPKLGTTHSSSIELWPIFDIDKSQGVNEDGSTWVSEDGDAVLIVHWSDRKTYDTNGLVIECANDSEIWPFFNTSCAKGPDGKSSSGTILLFFKYGSSGQ